MPPRKENWRRFGPVAFIFGIVVVLWTVFPPMDPVFALTTHYIGIAENIARNGGYFRLGAGGRLIPETLREPLYPYALFAARAILGGYDKLVPLQKIAIVGACLFWILGLWHWLGWVWAAALTALIALNPVLFFYGAVLYPYAFNVFFFSAGLFCTLRLLARKEAKWAILAGLTFGLAAYERGSLALFPMFLGGILLLFPWLVQRRLVVGLCLTYAMCIAPWIWRNHVNGIGGMSGMMGWTLGYTYGSMVCAQEGPGAATKVDPFGLRSDYIRHMEKGGAVDSDGGTAQFIFDQMAAGRSLGEINRAITYYVEEAIKADPMAALGKIRRNLQLTPCRLLVMAQPELTSWKYYLANICVVDPNWADESIVVLGLLGVGLMIGNREIILLIILPPIIYLVAINSVLTVMDPRYRNGIFDIFAYVCVLYAIRCLFFQLTRGSWRSAKVGNWA
jgi:hypothetical protein